VLGTPVWTVEVNILRQSRRLYGCGPLKGAFSQPTMVQESAAAQTRAMRAQTAKTYSRKCQTLTATPAEPGVLPGAIGSNKDPERGVRRTLGKPSGAGHRAALGQSIVIWVRYCRCPRCEGRPVGAPGASLGMRRHEAQRGEDHAHRDDHHAAQLDNQVPPQDFRVALQLGPQRP
jgi:hypothetical protein